MPFHIVLDREGEEFVQRMVDSKRYHDASDVLMHALVLLEDQEKLHELKQAELDEKIEAGLRDIRAGRVHDAEEVFQEMEELIAKKAKRQDAAE
jgi:antitoxin ParD1/3/4